MQFRKMPNFPLATAMSTTILLYSAMANAQASDESRVDGHTTLPRAVNALVDRIVGCNHWLGEPPYDAERAKEIAAVVTELRCKDLMQDKTDILGKYGTDAAVRRAIEKAEDTVL